MKEIYKQPRPVSTRVRRGVGTAACLLPVALVAAGCSSSGRSAGISTLPPDTYSSRSEQSQFSAAALDPTKGLDTAINAAFKKTGKAPFSWGTGTFDVPVSGVGKYELSEDISSEFAGGTNAAGVDDVSIAYVPSGATNPTAKVDLVYEERYNAALPGTDYAWGFSDDTTLQKDKTGTTKQLSSSVLPDTLRLAATLVTDMQAGVAYVPSAS